MDTQPTNNRIGIIFLYVLTDLFLILFAVLLAWYGSLSGFFAVLAQYSWVVLLLGGLTISIVGIVSKKDYANARAVFLHGLFVILFGFWLGVVRNFMLTEEPSSDVAALFNFGTICLLVVTVFLQIDLLFSDRLRYFLTTDKKQTYKSQNDEWVMPEISKAEKKSTDFQHKKMFVREEKKPSIADDDFWWNEKPSPRSDASDTPTNVSSLFDDDDYSKRVAARVAARAKARSEETLRRRKSFSRPIEESDELFLRAVNEPVGDSKFDDLFF